MPLPQRNVWGSQLKFHQHTGKCLQGVFTYATKQIKTCPDEKVLMTHTYRKETKATFKSLFIWRAISVFEQSPSGYKQTMDRENVSFSFFKCLSFKKNCQEKIGVRDSSFGSGRSEMFAFTLSSWSFSFSRQSFFPSFVQRSSHLAIMLAVLRTRAKNNLAIIFLSFA